MGIIVKPELFVEAMAKPVYDEIKKKFSSVWKSSILS